MGSSIVRTALGVARGGLARLRHSREPAVRSLPGLAGRVEILTDRFGVAHVYADHVHDLFFAQGWVTARDRLFQMDLARVLAAGRTSEVLGRRRLDWRELTIHLRDRTTVDLDVFVRTFGIARAAAASVELHSEEARDILRSYAAGVTAYVAHGAPTLEHRLLRRRPEAWTAADSLAVLRAMGFELNVAWRAIVFGMMLSESGLPDDVSSALWPHVAARHPDGEEPDPPGGAGVAVARELAGLRGASSLGYGDAPGVGSNAFAVAGTHTLGGAALLANDTHLVSRVPTPWHEIHLVGGGLDLHGFALAGVPGIAVGRTPHHAWGITAGLVHDLDFFRERLDPDDDRRYLTPSGWEAVASRDEIFLVRGEGVVRREIRETRHGPLIEGLRATPAGGERLAVCWSGGQPGRDLDGLLGVWRATSLPEIEAALAHHVTPTFNVIYAGRDGRIAHFVAGRLPKRRREAPLRPLEGWTGEWDWHGYHPFADNPRVVSPAEGFVVSANQRVADEGTAVELGKLFEPPLRASRIRERLLALGDKVALEDLASIQLDVHSRFGLALRDAIFSLEGGKDALNPHGSALGQSALELWAGWDGEASAGSAGACVGLTMASIFGRELVRALAGDDAALAFVEMGALAAFPLLDALAMAPRLAELGADVTTVAAESFDKAMAACRAKLGDDPAAWRWGDMHGFAAAHPLGRSIVGRLFSLPSAPVGGGLDTVNRADPDPRRGFRVRVAPAMRMVVNARDRDQAGTVLPGGQSGDVLSPHYDDQLELYVSGRLKPAPVSRELVEVASREVWHGRA